MTSGTTSTVSRARGPAFALALVIVLTTTYIVYTPGLGGAFLFDDFATLPKLSDYGDLTQPRAFLYYVIGSGPPAGRLAPHMARVPNRPRDRLA